MRHLWTWLGVSCVCGPLLVAPVQAETIEEATRCKIVKLKASVKELKDKAQCYERSFKMNVPVSSKCLERAEHKRSRLYERAEERGGCETTGDGAAFSARIDSFLSGVTRSLESADGAKKTSATPESKPSKDATTESGAAPTAPGPGASPAPSKDG